MSIAKQPEKIHNPLDVEDVDKISNEVSQLYLENSSQDFINEIIKEMYNLYSEERFKNISYGSINFDFEQFLVEKKQNPDNIIQYCLNNQFDPRVQIILAFCYEYGRWVEKDE